MLSKFIIIKSRFMGLLNHQ